VSPTKSPGQESDITDTCAAKSTDDGGTGDAVVDNVIEHYDEGARRDDALARALDFDI